VAELTRVVSGLQADPARRAAMAEAMRGLARPGAAARVADELLRLAGAA
jgi:UDP-N-acetylglucosamine:LPS N-acetylglucosamine transferase